MMANNNAAVTVNPVAMGMGQMQQGSPQPYYVTGHVVAPPQPGMAPSPPQVYAQPGVVVSTMAPPPPYAASGVVMGTVVTSEKQ
jgi:hypothetical protein